jgi:ATP-binding cassette subfamily B protein/ATP-binding cassette subfamily C protein/ATP-binding cassette subfamily B multidrug efflux pump
VTRSRALRSDINAQAAESISGMAVVQASGATAAFAERFAATNAAHYAARRQELRANAWLLRPVLDLLNVMLLAAVIGVFN